MKCASVWGIGSQTPQGAQGYFWSQLAGQKHVAKPKAQTQDRKLITSSTLHRDNTFRHCTFWLSHSSQETCVLSLPAVSRPRNCLRPRNPQLPRGTHPFPNQAIAVVSTFPCKQRSCATTVTVCLPCVCFGTTQSMMSSQQAPSIKIPSPESQNASFAPKANMCP